MYNVKLSLSPLLLAAISKRDARVNICNVRKVDTHEHMEETAVLHQEQTFINSSMNSQSALVV